MSRLRVRQQDGITEIEALAGERILDALRRGGIQTSAPCGGRGTCGNCRVKLSDSNGNREVLACQTEVWEDCLVEVPDQSGGLIETDLPAAGAGEQVAHAEWYGIALDLGTTTVAAALYALTDQPARVDVLTAWNAQSSFGGDVISRVHYCMTTQDGLAELGRVIRCQTGELIRSLCQKNGIAMEKVKKLTVGGNPIMQHLFAGLDPSAIARAPYIPDTYFSERKTWLFAELPGIATELLPCVSGYIGGDITAGLLACNLLEDDGIALFLDIGTNGEMVLCDHGQMLSCSVASGPAFEGAEIACGMTSVEGAVNRVTWSGTTFCYETIGGTAPKGLCGSGLIDLLALLLELEIVDETGRLLPPEEVPQTLRRWLTEDENENGIFHLTEQVYLTAADVRKLQLAKAAVAAGIQVLQEETGIPPEQVDRLLLAGGFGAHLRPASAVKIGMIPEQLENKVISVGNSSLAGVAQSLCDEGAWDRLQEIRERCRYLELSGHAGLSEAFIDHMSFEEDA